MVGMAPSQSTGSQYGGVIVNKPWGYEYLIYENAGVALWYLHINPGNRTSLHCHTRKKTGLILLAGEAEVSYLNDSVRLKAVGKLMIRPGLFHSTAALSPEGIALLEIETPPEKENLVRLDDTYGRKEKPYEGMEAITPISGSYIQLQLPPKDQTYTYRVHGCVLSMVFMETPTEAHQRPPEEIIIVLGGGLFSKTNDQILGPGDVVTTNTLVRLADSFATPSGIYFLAIRKED